MKEFPSHRESVLVTVRMLYDVSVQNAIMTVSSKKAKTVAMFFLITCTMVSCKSTVTSHTYGSSKSAESVSTVLDSAAEALPAEPKSLGDGSTYLTVVNSVNCIMRSILATQNLHLLGDGTIDPVAIDELRTLYSKLSSARQVAVRELLEREWPEVVAGDIELLARDWAKQARLESDISQANDLGQWNSAISRSNGHISSAASNPGYIRASLGLGEASVTDQC